MPTTPPDTEQATRAPAESQAMAAVRAAGQKLAGINAQREEAIAELRVALRAADAEGGHTRSELVTAAGVARQTVYDALKKPAAEPNALVQSQLEREARASIALDRDQTHVIGS